MDKAKIKAGRAIVDSFYTAHQALHSKPWTKDVPLKHTPLAESMSSQLKQVGFNDPEELAIEEYTEHLLSLKLATSSPLRFLDVSNLSHAEFSAFNEVVLKLRADDTIPDTILYRYLQGGQTIAHIGSDAHRERCKQNGIPYYRILTASIHRGILFHDDVLGRLATKDRFTDLSDAWEAMLSVVVKTLWSFGVEVSTRPRTNNVQLSGKKVAQGIKREYKDVYFILTATFQDFDYDLGALVFDEPDIRDKVTTLKEVLGQEIPASEFKAAYIQSCLQTFSSPINEESLNAEEQSLLSYLKPKYESKAWNDSGQTDTVLVGIGEIVNADNARQRSLA